MTDLGPDQRPEGWSLVPSAYDTIVAPFTALFAHDALRLANVGPGQRVLDVGAGTGVLSLAAAALGAEVLATDFSPGMIDYLKGKTNAQGISNVQAVVMDGQALDVAENTFDAAFSIFGLMFFPDRAAGFRELYRAIRSKGLAVVTSWSSIERLRFAQAILGTLREAVPDLPAPQRPPPWLSLADRSAFKAEMHAVGFAHVNMFSVTHVWTFTDPEVLFEALPGLSPAFTSILGTLQPAQREAFRTAFLRRIRGEQGNGPFGLEGEAHIAVGRSPRRRGNASSTTDPPNFRIEPTRYSLSSAAASGRGSCGALCRQRPTDRLSSCTTNRRSARWRRGEGEAPYVRPRPLHC